jgi:hypothetical protein
MEGMTTNDKLLAQDDIDALLGEAGIEGNYEGNYSEKKPSVKKQPEKPVVRYSRITDEEVLTTMSLLRNKAWLERGDEIKVIWNASGSIPMATGFLMDIQDKGYVSLGVLRNNHLVVREKDD